MTTVTFTAAVTYEAPWYVARCLDVEVTSQAKSEEEALAHLKEALEPTSKIQLSLRVPSPRSSPRSS